MNAPVTEQELAMLIGAKDIEIYVLRREMGRLKDELTKLKEPKEPPVGDA